MFPLTRGQVSREEHENFCAKQNRDRLSAENVYKTLGTMLPVLSRCSGAGPPPVASRYEGYTLDRPPNVDVPDQSDFPLRPKVQIPKKIESFSIGERIYGGENTLSQVVRVTAINGVSVESQPLLLKLYDDAFIPQDNDWYPATEAYTVCEGATSAKNECWAYDTLQRHQGKTIPWSYGFYLVKTPWDTEIVGHLVEEVIAPTLEKLLRETDKPLDQSMLFPLLDALTRAIYQMHSCGVANGDLKTHHVLVIPRGAMPPDIVLFDFGECKQTFKWHKISSRERDCDRLYDSIRQTQKVSHGDVKSWRTIRKSQGIEEELGQAWDKTIFNPSRDGRGFGTSEDAPPP
ncbi:hypothetical protein DL96DRAFT_1819929 [Flagelloscypha sp. PMI_526]|nr:hypothetical protein DL96DRAFT_1819929 [Flagelloscypha sp. PMI_526]